jgi:hypothetical protein
MSSTTDPFRYDDGAYVLGALDDADRRAFEAHLETCAECRARVAAVRPAVDLLAGLTVKDVAAPEPMPDTLLPGLLRAAHRERARRSWFVRGVGLVAAACALALAVVLWPSGGSAPPSEAFVPLRPSPVSATAQLVSRTWGTEIDMHCTYAKQLESYLPYRLQVVDKANETIPAGTWRLAPGGETDFVTVTDVPRDQISRLQITTPDGTPILELRA